MFGTGDKFSFQKFTKKLDYIPKSISHPVVQTGSIRLMASSPICMNATSFHLNSYDLVQREVWTLLQERSLVIVAKKERGSWLHLHSMKFSKGSMECPLCQTLLSALGMGSWGGVKNWGQT